jgi:hypothetical protein
MTPTATAASAGERLAGAPAGSRAVAAAEWIEDVPMGAQREDQPGQVCAQQDDRGNDRNLLRVRLELERAVFDRWQPLTVDHLEHPRKDQHGYCQEEHQHRGRDGGLVEALLVPLPASEQHSQAHDQHHVAEHRAGDRGLHDFVEAGIQGEQGDGHLACVAEGDVQQAAEPGPRPRGGFLGCETHQRCGRDHA